MNINFFFVKRNIFLHEKNSETTQSQPILIVILDYHLPRQNALETTK